MEHVVNKLKKTHTHTHYKNHTYTHPNITKQTHTHTHTHTQVFIITFFLLHPITAAVSQHLELNQNSFNLMFL